MEREFFKIDLTTGERLDVSLFDPDEETIPADYVEGWQGRVFHDPKWDFGLNDWVESHSVADIISKMKDPKIAALSQQCEEVIKAGFYYGEDFFAFQDKDQTNFNQQLSLMIVEPSITMTFWKTENFGIKQFTRDQFIEICKTAERHKRDNIGKFWQLRSYVETHEFTSVDEFNAVSFETWSPAV